MNRSRTFSFASALLLAVTTLALTACGHNYDNLYPTPAFNFAGRPIPPSQLLNRVMVAIDNPSGLSGGGLEILDGKNDLRHNIQNTVTSWSINGYAGNLPKSIQNFPDELQGFVYASGDGSFDQVNYGTEASAGAVGAQPGFSNSITIDGEFTNVYAAEEQLGYFTVYSRTTTTLYPLNLPNVYQVATNPAGTVALAMVRNSNTLYRVVKLSSTGGAPPAIPTGSIDCRPIDVPVFCVVPVPGTFDHPIGAYFSLDGTQVYVLNCGPECGGTTASISYLSITPLLEDNPAIPTTNQVLSQTNVPGGVTTVISDGTYLYAAGQSLQSGGTYNGLFSGNLSIITMATQAITTYPISDGIHTKLIFGDNNTLWIGGNTCAEGVRAAKAAAGITTQDANYNCLTRFVLGANSTSNPYLPAWTAHTTYNLGARVSDGTNIEVMVAGTGLEQLNGAEITQGTTGSGTPAWGIAPTGTTPGGTVVDGSLTWANIGPVTQAEIIPGISPNSATSNIPIQWQNVNGSAVYYGDLTGICWVEDLNKMYTAYGGQIHLFGTADGGEHDNSQITVQGTAADVAYIDATTDIAD
jgi:hypothetical protein